MRQNEVSNYQRQLLSELNKFRALPRMLQGNFLNFFQAYIIFMILIFSLSQFSQGYLTSGVYFYLMPWALPIAQISLTGSIYFTVAITIER